MTETAETEGDHIAAFARRHRISETELRSYVAEGPRWVRWFLEQVGVVDDYPRAPAVAARSEAQEE